MLLLKDVLFEWFHVPWPKLHRWVFGPGHRHRLVASFLVTGQPPDRAGDQAGDVQVGV